MSDTRMSPEAQRIHTLTCATCAYFALKSPSAPVNADDARGHCRRRLHVSSTLLPNGTSLQSAFYPEVTRSFPCCGEYESTAEEV